MNRITILLMITLVALCSVSEGQSIDEKSVPAITPDKLYPPADLVIPYHTDWSKNNYQKRIGEFKKKPLETNDIVFIGDSITERITEQGADWGARFGSSRIKNRGISGDVTEGVLQRLGEAINIKPQAVFILIGINDISASKTPQFIADNIVKIAAEIKKGSPASKIYVRTILPTADPKQEDNIKATNEILRKKATSGSYTLIDLHKIFAGDKNLLKKELTFDGLHLNDKGYKLWVDSEKKIIDDLVKTSIK